MGDEIDGNGREQQSHEPIGDIEPGGAEPITQRHGNAQRQPDQTCE